MSIVNSWKNNFWSYVWFSLVNNPTWIAGIIHNIRIINLSKCFPLSCQIWPLWRKNVFPTTKLMNHKNQKKQIKKKKKLLNSLPRNSKENKTVKDWDLSKVMLWLWEWWCHCPPRVCNHWVPSLFSHNHDPWCRVDGCCCCC